MAIGGAFLGGGVEVVPAGSCKLELEILTEDRANLTATFTIKGTSTYTVTAGADGRAVYTVPSGQTYTVSVNTTDYDNLASQTVVAESGTVRYVRFEAFAGRVKRSGDVISGTLTFYKPWIFAKSANADNIVLKNLSITGSETGSRNMSIDHTDNNNTLRGQILFSTNKYHSSGAYLLAGNGSGVTQSICIVVNDNGTYNANAPTPSDMTDNSTQIATTAWVNQTNFLVHSYGAETIAGIKTFSADPIVLKNAPSLIIKDTKYALTDALPENWTYGWIQALGKDGKSIGRFTVRGYTDGKRRIYQEIFGRDGTSSAHLSLWINDKGLAYAEAPNPDTGVSEKIVTADWCIGKFVNKSGDTMTGDLSIYSPMPTVWGSSSDFAITDTVTTWKSIASVRFKDKNNQLLGGLFSARDTNGFQRTYIACLNSNGTTIHDKTLALAVKADGTTCAEAPTPSSKTDNSAKIATTAWVNQANFLVHSYGNESVSGQKTFKDIMWRHISDNSAGLIINHTKAKGSTETYYNDIVWRDESIYRAYIRCNLFPDGESVQIVPRNATGGYAGEPLTVKWTSTNGMEVHVPTPPSNSNGVNAVNTSWANTKLAQKNKVTNVTSYTQLIELIKNGKRGDSFGITMDYVGGSIGGIYATDREVHAFGHYTIDEITVSGGALTGLQAFGSGEVSGKLKNDDDTTYVYATSGFGRQSIGTGVFDAFRVAEDGKLTYFVANSDSANITAFEGYYISI